MNAKSLARMGIPAPLVARAGGMIGAARRDRRATDDIRRVVAGIVATPDAFLEDPHFGPLAAALCDARATAGTVRPRETPLQWRQWGGSLEPDAVGQMNAAMCLPVAVGGALMADAHVGYGLPIGGVLATEGAVVPYAVGVDIACRMKLSVLDLPPEWLDTKADRLATAIEDETRFGVGAVFGHRGDARRTRPREHPVLDDDWSVSPVTARHRDKARAQLGTSGSGNHFVEFGTFTVEAAEAAALGLASGGTFLALLSHSGSRGTGAAVCDHYSRLAMDRCRDLPGSMRHLGWLSLASEAGQEYWAAMTLMGRYAAANHACIHRHVAAHLGATVILDVENHHNFAWDEEHVVDGIRRRVIVHRKGATPAGRGVLGIIPGSMAAPGFLVRGRGVAASLDSASHGAGRRMSRTKARETYRWKEIKPLLASRRVRLLSAGIDEVPQAYKDIHAVMAAQADLVEIVGRFDPRLVKMAPDGEKPED
ncbi:MAG: RtcB family protein [Planctomycetaceae bacterium]